MRRLESPLALARAIAPERAAHLEREIGTGGGRVLGIALGAAYPALRPAHGWQIDALDRIFREGWRSRRSREFVLPLFRRHVFEHRHREGRLSEIRRLSWEQRA